MKGFGYLLLKYCSQEYNRTDPFCGQDTVAFFVNVTI